MTVIRTVLGDLAPEAIDRVLPHEHLLCDFSRVTKDRNHIFNNPQFAIRELGELNAAVVPDTGRQHLLVEVTLPDLGRDPGGLVRIARESGTHVMMGTGWYLEPYYPERIYHASATVLADAMTKDITDGVELADGTRVKAGVIGEIGTDGPTVSPAEERVLRAAARAANSTGAAVTTHAFMYPSGSAQLDILEEEGVDPRRIAIGHVDTFLDPHYHLDLARRGVYLQFDTCGREHLMPDRLRVEMIELLLSEGFAESILLSSDRCHQTDLKLNGGLGYEWAVAGFCDLLRAAGIDDATLETLTRSNPIRLLAGIRA